MSSRFTLPLAVVALSLTGFCATAQVVPPPPFVPGAPPAQNFRLPPPPIPQHRMHQVAKGENLWKISRSYYGSGGLWKVLAKANPGVKSRDLKPGTMLVIP